MKKILLFFILISLSACENLKNRSNQTLKIACPNIFFSSENNVYLHGDTKSLDFEKIDYKASLNNYGFENDCFADLERNNYLLSLLILIEPFNTKSHNINLPIFAILYDENENIMDKQYFRLNQNLNYDKEISDLEINEIITSLNISIKKDKTVKSITIGFVKINE